MKVVIRTDASLQIGSGHVMRCLTLADELRRRGAQVVFICREHSGHLCDLIAKKDFAVVRLASTESVASAAENILAHAAWLGATWLEDAEATVAAVGASRPDWVIVDHYALDRRWEERLRPHTDNLMVIDDLADRPHDCDLLLDQNLYEEMDQRYAELVPSHCRRLLGPRYALLRQEFVLARNSMRQREGVVRRLLIFYGATDLTNETEKALLAVRDLAPEDVEIDVVVGAANPHHQKIEALCRTLPGTKLHCQVANMAALMAAADLALCAGGTTTWERCAVGLPGLVTAVAENQLELSRVGSRQGLSFYLGPAAAVSSAALRDALRSFLRAPDNLLAYAKQGLATVDGRGTQRLAGVLAPPQITLRSVRWEDCDAIYRWRNAEETRRYIFDAEPIPLQRHREWFRNTMNSTDRLLLIGEVGSQPVGVLRYDLSGAEALISVYLVPGGQGQGVGTQLIRQGSCWLRKHHPAIRKVKAEIFRENAASLRAFEQAGFHEHHLTYQEVFS